MPDGPHLSDDALFLHGVISSFWLPPTIAAACCLGVPDIVGEEPLTASEIAGRAATDADATARLLDALTSVGIFAKHEDGRYAATGRSRLLRNAHPSQIGPLFEIGMTGENFAAWLSLVAAIRSGGCAFDIQHGVDWVEYLRQRPEREKQFAAAMTATTRAAEDAILGGYDFGAFDCLVDVGGSHGSFVGAVLERYPEARGIVFDLPSTVEAGRQQWRDRPYASRLEAIGGDFFRSVPAGDVHVLKQILHDWSDDRAVAILRAIRQAMPPAGRLLIIEIILSDSAEPHPGWGLDMTMMVCTGGRERTHAHYSALLRKAGLAPVSLFETPSPLSVLEARPAT